MLVVCLPARSEITTVTQVGVEATAVGIFRMKKSSCRLKLVCPGAWRGVCPSDYPRSGN
jgi:hypothetical protein